MKNLMLNQVTIINKKKYFDYATSPNNMYSALKRAIHETLE